MPDELLTVTRAAAELSRSPRTVLDWITSGRLHAQKIGPGRTNAYVITRDELDRVKADQAAKAAS